MKPFTFGSLFAGIGAGDLAFTRARLKCEWQVSHRSVLTVASVVSFMQLYPNIDRGRTIFAENRDSGIHLFIACNRMVLHSI